jgi:hypothetical protein
MKRAPFAMRILFALTLAACGGTSVDPATVPEIADYKTWPAIAESGEVPGHGDSFRVIYYNPVAQTYPHAGHYPLGSVMVKEIHPAGGTGSNPGPIDELDIMRKVGDDMGQPTQNGWLFTTTDSAGKTETAHDSCWSTCHKQAPHDGAWFDYGN